jgi:sporulation protein YlmC with PRC-barrel domain
VTTRRPHEPPLPAPAGTHLIDARLHLLDRQLLDDDGHPVGIVDDLDLEQSPDGPPRVAEILSGQIVATRILGGRVSRDRLQSLPWRLVRSVGTVVTLLPTDTPFDSQWVERWLRERVIGRIPGGRHAAQ